MEDNNLSFSYLISTMNDTTNELVLDMNIDHNAVVINQCMKEDSQYIINEGKTLWINSTDKGLSKSRNMAIDNSKGDICLVCDDDMHYYNCIHETILKEFEKNKDVDIITFQVQKYSSIYKKYPPTKKRLNFFTTMKVSSVEMAFRRESINSKNLRFREEFGAGSIYSMGEENIFLNDARNKGLKIMYVPIRIGTLSDSDESSWFKGYTERYFFNQGAVYAALGSFMSIALILQYLVRKRSVYKSGFSVLDISKIMFKGRKDYLNSSERR